MYVCIYFNARLYLNIVLRALVSLYVQLKRCYVKTFQRNQNIYPYKFSTLRTILRKFKLVGIQRPIQLDGYGGNKFLIYMGRIGRSGRKIKEGREEDKRKKWCSREWRFRERRRDRTRVSPAAHLTAPRPPLQEASFAVPLLILMHSAVLAALCTRVDGRLSSNVQPRSPTISTRNAAGVREKPRVLAHCRWRPRSHSAANRPRGPVVAPPIVRPRRFCAPVLAEYSTDK